MKKLLISLMMMSFMISADVENEVGRYQLAVSTYIGPKSGKMYIVETVLDTKTGKIVKRTKKRASSYKLPYKNRMGRIITSD